jgi:PAS domain S-box-containing protein
MDKHDSLRQRVESYFKENEKSASAENILELKRIVQEFSDYNDDLEKQNQGLDFARQQLSERYSDIFENAPVGYLILGSELKILEINKAASQLLEKSNEQAKGEAFESFVEPEYLKLFHSCFKELLTGDNNSQCDLKLKSSDSAIFARIIVRAVVPENDLEKFRVALIDITKEKELEEKLLEESKRARENERLNSAFMANMSHEIRTPMNGIIGFTELLQEPDLSAESLQTYINVIQKSGKRMLSLINELIDISKIESGSVRPVSTKTNVNELLDYLYEFFLPETGKRGLKLELALDNAEESLQIKTDKEKLHAVFVNLIKNAFNYTSEGKISFGYIKEDGHIQFFVKDTGRGIPEDEQTKVFGRFYRADEDAENSVEGAGLGLAISKAYVEMLGGNIWVESEPGNGSTFCFTIPVVEADDKNGEAENQLSVVNDASELINYLTVLVAEDDEPARVYLSELLNGNCKKLFFAKNGREAVEIYSEEKPDLVLMDIKMPVMDGYSAAIKIKGMDENAMIIAQTAYALAGDREKALAAGCSDYLAKPVLKEDLLAMICKHFM